MMLHLCFLQVQVSWALIYDVTECSWHSGGGDGSVQAVVKDIGLDQDHL